VEGVVGDSVIPPVTVTVVGEVAVAVVVDVAGGTDARGAVSSVVVVPWGGRVVVTLGTTVSTGISTAGTSWVGGAGSGRTQR
jgi:hypothetical protein